MYVGSASLVAASEHWALVTGASSGLGKCLSLELAARGANIVGTSRQMGRLEDVRKEVVANKVEFLPVVCDAAEPDGWQAIVKACEGKAIKYAFLNAGSAVVGAFSHVNEREIASYLQMMIVTNVALVDHFSAGDTRVVLSSSLTAECGGPGGALYCASKAFLTELARSVPNAQAVQPGAFVGSGFFHFPAWIMKIAAIVFPGAGSVAAGTMRGLGRSKVLDYSIHSVFARVFRWFVGDWVWMWVGRVVWWLLPRSVRGEEGQGKDKGE